jgi:DUF4097 and DUF4098 domain-containing protein YvlB
MKTITGVFVLSALVGPSNPASAQGNLAYQIERIVDYSLTIAADALAELVDDRADRDDRQDRQRGRGGRDDRGPEFTETFNRTVRLGRTGRLELENVSGDVEVTANSGDEVRITATKRVRARDEATGRATLSATEIQVVERAGLLTISSGPTRGRFNSIEVDFVISVPSGTALSLQTVSGDVIVTGLAGDAQLKTMSGDVVLKNARPRDVEIEVVSGDVSLEQVDSERVQVKSLSGDIILAGKLAKAGHYELKTNSGDIQVIPEGNPGFNVEAATFSGDVSSDFPLKLIGRNSFTPADRGSRRNNDVRGTVNDGGAVLSLHSLSGDILITKR